MKCVVSSPCNQLPYATLVLLVEEEEAADEEEPSPFRLLACKNFCRVRCCPGVMPRLPTRSCCRHRRRHRR